MSITVYAGAPTFVRHAAHRLSDHTGIPIGSDDLGGPALRLERNAGSDPTIGPQGYAIRAADASTICISGNDDEGVANGVYTMLRTLLIECRVDPFERRWDLVETPPFRIRGMYVAPYRFGGSYGFAVLSPDRWSIEEWIEYVDLMRLCNVTTLTLVPGGRIYHPDYPETARERWRYEVWRDVMAYCHQVGMKFNWLTTPNYVPQQVFWENPSLRVEDQEAGGYYGCGLVWSKAKDLILDVSRYTFEYFRGLDGLEMIYSETGLSFDEATAADPAGYFADATDAYRKLLRESGNDADFVFWNWIFDLWASVVIPESLLERHPKFRTMLDDLLPLLPKDIGWADASMLSVAQMFGPEIRARRNPALREGGLLGKKWGFDPVINCFWYMNPEYALNMLPHPYLARAIQEAAYSRDELRSDGVQGYRLAPPCRFLGDYAFFRLAFDPSLTQEELVFEMASLLCEAPANRSSVAEAINLLESFWIGHELASLERAEDLFERAAATESSKHLARVSGGTTFLTSIVRMAQPAVSTEARKKMRWELYQHLKTLDVFQGITSDIIWQPEAYAFFCWQVDLMIRQYRWYRTSRPDVVDRTIYPEATAEFATLKWPQGVETPDASKDRPRGEMPGPLTYD
jgi:hypothetical protein